MCFTSQRSLVLSYFSSTTVYPSSVTNNFTNNLYDNLDLV